MNSIVTYAKSLFAYVAQYCGLILIKSSQELFSYCNTYSL